MDIFKLKLDLRPGQNIRIHDFLILKLLKLDRKLTIPKKRIGNVSAVYLRCDAVGLNVGEEAFSPEKFALIVNLSILTDRVFLHQSRTIK